MPGIKERVAQAMSRVVALGNGPAPDAEFLPPLSDPENPEDDLSPKDFDLVEVDQDQTEEMIVKMVDERFDYAREEQQPFQSTWMESLAFFRGQQWSRWDARSSRMISIVDARDKHRIFAQFNLLIPRVYKLVARAMSSKTTAGVSPATMAEADVAATAEAQAVLAHLDRLFARDSQNRDIATGCMVVGPHFLKIGWDPTAVVPLPQTDEQGNVAAISDQEAGELFEDIVPCTEMFVDPTAKKWEDVRWVIHATSRPLSYIQERYGRRGYSVEADSEDRSFLRSVIDSITGAKSSRPRNSATLMEMWGKPSKRYPGGRYIVKAGRTLLVNTSWPYRKLARTKGGLLPFSPISYRTGILTFWGDNAISACVEPQICFNRGVSRTQEHIRSGSGRILAPRGSEIKQDDFHTGRRDEVTYYTADPALGGIKPEYFPQVPLDPAIARSMEQAQFIIDDTMEVHDVSQGGKPPSIDSGVGVIAVQQSDQTASAIFAEHQSYYHITRAEIELAIASEFYIEPRLLHVQQNQDQPDVPGLPESTPAAAGMGPGAPGVPSASPAPGAQTAMGAFAGSNPGGTAVPAFAPSSVQGQGAGVQVAGGPQFAGNPGGGGMPMPDGGAGIAPGVPGPQMTPQAIKAAMQVQTFKALGTGRVQVSASTSSPQTPQARTATILNMFKSGMFEPQAIPVTLAMLKAMDIENPDKLTEDIISMLRQFQGMQPSQMDQAQAQAQADGLKAQVQARLEAELQAVKDHSTAQGKLLDLHSQMALNLQKHHLALGQVAAQHPLDMQKIGAEHQHGAMGADKDAENAKEQAAMGDKKEDSK